MLLKLSKAYLNLTMAELGCQKHLAGRSKIAKISTITGGYYNIS